MSNESTSTTAAGLVRSEYVDAAMDVVCTTELDALANLPWTKTIMIPPGKGKTGVIRTFTRDAHGDKTEGTALGNTQADFSTVTIAASEVGIIYDVSDLLSYSADAPVEDFLAARAAEACMDAMETDICALYSGFSTGFNGAGSDMTVAGIIAGKAQLAYTNKAKGTMHGVLAGIQAQHLDAAIVAATGCYFGNSSINLSVIDRGQADGYVGNFAGIDWWVSSHCPLANSDADRVGAIYVDGNSAKSPSHAIAILRMPYTKMGPNPANASDLVGIFAAYGVGEVCDLSGVYLKSHAA